MNYMNNKTNNKTKQTLAKTKWKIQRNRQQWVHRTQNEDKSKARNTTQQSKKISNTDPSKKRRSRRVSISCNL
jgi:hypothetical protein